METPKEITKINDYLEKINSESLTGESAESFTALYELMLQEVGPQIGKEYYTRGLEAYQNGDYETAVQELTRAAAYDTGNVDAYFNLANAYRKMEKNEEAITVYEKIIELFPSAEKANRSQSYLNELKKEQ